MVEGQDIERLIKSKSHHAVFLELPVATNQQFVEES